MQAHRLAALSAIVLYACSAAAPIVKDLDGRSIQVVEPGISVLLFTRTDCPISNRYAPEIARLYQRFRPSGVRFRLVYVDRRESVDKIRLHQDAYGYPFNAVMDPRHDLVRFAGVKNTPEVAVYASNRLVYRGRIDNRFVRLGVSRPSATVHDLEDTLVQAVSGVQLPFRSEPAVGCFIEDLR